MDGAVTLDADEIGLLRYGFITLREMKLLTDKELNALKFLYHARQPFRGVISLCLPRVCRLCGNPL